MDEMDYVMQHSDPSASQAQQQNTSGCPYWRDHHTTLPQLSPSPGSASSPSSNNHPQNHNHSHNLNHNFNQAMVSPIRNLALHPRYDPVHASSNTQWYQQPQPPFQWNPPHAPPHSRSAGDSFYQSATSVTNNSAGGGAGGGGGGAGAAGITGMAGTTGPHIGGLVQPSLNNNHNLQNLQNLNSQSHNQQQQTQQFQSQQSQPPTALHPPNPLHHDQFPQQQFPFVFRHPPHLHRFTAGPPQLPPSIHPAPQQQMSFTQDRSVPPQQQQQQQQQQPGAPRVINLPALNPHPPPPPPPPAPSSQVSHIANTNNNNNNHHHHHHNHQQQAPQQANDNMSSSTDSSPAGSSGQPGRPPFIPSTGSMLSGLPEPPRTHPNVFILDPTRSQDTNPTPDLGGPSSNDNGPLTLPITPPVPPNTERRRQASTRQRRSMTRPSSQDSDYDSEEETVQLEDEQALRFLEQFSAHPFRVGMSEEANENRIRASQLLRGQMTNKRIASKSALASLQSVEIGTLPDSERMCVICYNEFGVPNPEGINEAPLRLPKCKHVFGDHCIKKWFEESDSCPYCRDKVPSEPQIRAGSQALRDFFRVSYGPRYHRTGIAAPTEDEGPTSSSYAAIRAGDAYRDPYLRLIRADGYITSFHPAAARAWQTGERRSPPSEASENRRRTRPRHGSFRGSPSGTGPSANRPNSYAGVTPAAPLQQSPARERVNPPNLPPHWVPFSQTFSQFSQFVPDPRRSMTRSLTPLFPRQFPPGNHRPLYNNYSSNYSNNGGNVSRQMPPAMSLYGEPMNPSVVPNSGGQHQNFMNHPSFVAPLLNPGPQEQPYPNPLNGGPGALPVEPGHPFPGPPSMTGSLSASMTAFSQHLRPMEGQGYPAVSNPANGQSSSNPDGW